MRRLYRLRSRRGLKPSAARSALVPVAFELSELGFRRPGGEKIVLRFFRNDRSFSGRSQRVLDQRLALIEDGPTVGMDGSSFRRGPRNGNPTAEATSIV